MQVLLHQHDGDGPSESGQQCENGFEQT
jgi:hypothetical protein